MYEKILPRLSSGCLCNCLVKESCFICINPCATTCILLLLIPACRDCHSTKHNGYIRQKPFAKPEKVLEYLSRYVFRIAISDQRTEKVENAMVYFTMKDYKNKGIFRKMKLQVNEFIFFKRSLTSCISCRWKIPFCPNG